MNLSSGRTTAHKYGAIDDIRQRYTGYERDAESGLDYAQARYYNSSHGRFTSPDPTLLSANGFNPQSWNRYAYVLNNPLMYTDPLGLWELQAVEQTKKKKNKDGTETEVYDRTVVIAVKTKDNDDGASLANQLGLTGKDAAKFAEKIGSGENIQLSEQGGDVGYVFGEVEQGLTDQKKWEIKNADKLDKLAAKNQFGPNNNDCSGTSCRVGLRDNVPLIGTNILDPRLDTEASAVDESNARVGDIVRYADENNVAKHFSNFIFRRDDGVPEVFSKSGTTGRYERRSASSLEGGNYGTIRGRKSEQSGYYRRK